MKFDIGDIVTLKTLNDLPMWYSTWDDFCLICGKKVLITGVTKINPEDMCSYRVIRDEYKYDVIDLVSAINGSACDSGMFVPGSGILSPRVGQKVHIKSRYDFGKNADNYRFGFYDSMMAYSKYPYLKVVNKRLHIQNTRKYALPDDYCEYTLATPTGEIIGYDWSSSMFTNNNPKFPYLF